MHTHHHSHEHSDISSMDETIALLQYMANHNASHTEELKKIAHNLENSGNQSAYERVMSAIENYEKGNGLIADALEELR